MKPLCFCSETNNGFMCFWFFWNKFCWWSKNELTCNIVLNGANIYGPIQRASTSHPNDCLQTVVFFYLDANSASQWLNSSLHKLNLLPEMAWNCHKNDLNSKRLLFWCWSCQNVSFFKVKTYFYLKTIRTRASTQLSKSEIRIFSRLETSAEIDMFNEYTSLFWGR